MASFLLGGPYGLFFHVYSKSLYLGQVAESTASNFLLDSEAKAKSVSGSTISFAIFPKQQQRPGDNSSFVTAL